MQRSHGRSCSTWRKTKARRAPAAESWAGAAQRTAIPVHAEYSASVEARRLPRARPRKSLRPPSEAVSKRTWRRSRKKKPARINVGRRYRTGERTTSRPRWEAAEKTIWRVWDQARPPVGAWRVKGKAFIKIPMNPGAVFVTFAVIARAQITRLAARPPAPDELPRAGGFRPTPRRRAAAKYVRLRNRAGRRLAGSVALKHPREGAGVITVNDARRRASSSCPRRRRACPRVTSSLHSLLHIAVAARPGAARPRPARISPLRRHGRYSHPAAGSHTRSGAPEACWRLASPTGVPAPDDDIITLDDTVESAGARRARSSSARNARALASSALIAAAAVPPRSSDGAPRSFRSDARQDRSRPRADSRLPPPPVALRAIFAASSACARSPPRITEATTQPRRRRFARPPPGPDDVRAHVRRVLISGGGDPRRQPRPAAATTSLQRRLPGRATKLFVLPPARTRSKRRRPGRDALCRPAEWRRPTRRPVDDNLLVPRAHRRWPLGLDIRHDMTPAARARSSVTSEAPRYRGRRRPAPQERPSSDPLGEAQRRGACVDGGRRLVGACLPASASEHASFAEENAADGGTWRALRRAPPSSSRAVVCACLIRSASRHVSACWREERSTGPSPGAWASRAGGPRCVDLPQVPRTTSAWRGPPQVDAPEAHSSDASSRRSHAGERQRRPRPAPRAGARRDRRGRKRRIRRDGDQKPGDLPAPK